MLATTALISTDALNGVIEMPGVVTEPAAAAVGSLTVTSCSELPLVVHLQAPERGTITFQLQNENLRDGDLDDDPADWNQLFNEIDQVDQIELPAGASVTIVVSFRPDPAESESYATPRRGGVVASSSSSSSSADASKNALRERHAITTACATIQLHAVPATAAAAPAIALSPSLLPAAPSTFVASMPAAAVASPPPPPPTTLSIVARQCVSVLRTDMHELSFDSCTIGVSAVRDFTVWNCSEAPLRFRLSVLHRGLSSSAVGARGWPQLDFLDADSDLRLSEAVVLGYSHARVRAYLMPSEVGQFSMELEVANLADCRNRELLRVHVAVTAQPQEEGLRLSGDGTLDFGSCYAGMPTRSLLAVKNTSAEALDVHFASEFPDEVSFSLAVDKSSDNDLEGHDREEIEEIEDDDGASPRAVDGGAAAARAATRADLASAAEEMVPEEESSLATGQRTRHIEELALLPGRERAVYVCYTPRLETVESVSGEAESGKAVLATALERKAFRIDVRGYPSSAGGSAQGGSSREVHSRSVQCRARVCASLVSVTPSVHQLGDCDIQTHKTATAIVRNLSELPAEIEISIISKVLTAVETQVTIGPRQAHELRFHFVPRRVNPYYRKEVTITNVHNPHDEHVVEFVANNVDRHNISFHSLFYSLALMRPHTARQPPAATSLLGGGASSSLHAGLGGGLSGVGSLLGTAPGALGMPSALVGRGSIGFDARYDASDAATTAAAAAVPPILADARELTVVPPDKCRVDFEEVRSPSPLSLCSLLPLGLLSARPSPAPSPPPDLPPISLSHPTSLRSPPPTPLPSNLHLPPHLPSTLRSSPAAPRCAPSACTTPRRARCGCGYARSRTRVRSRSTSRPTAPRATRRRASHHSRPVRSSASASSSPPTPTSRAPSASFSSIGWRSARAPSRAGAATARRHRRRSRTTSGSPMAAGSRCASGRRPTRHGGGAAASTRGAAAST